MVKADQNSLRVDFRSQEEIIKKRNKITLILKTLKFAANNKIKN